MENQNYEKMLKNSTKQEVKEFLEEDIEKFIHTAVSAPASGDVKVSVFSELADRYRILAEAYLEKWEALENFKNKSAEHDTFIAGRDFYD